MHQENREDHKFLKQKLTTGFMAHARSFSIWKVETGR